MKLLESDLRIEDRAQLQCLLLTSGIIGCEENVQLIISRARPPCTFFFFFSVVRALVQDSKFLVFLRLKDCGCIYVIKDVLNIVL